eukprot:8977530-Alexandrium_andersonii.AAC.1
MLAPALAQLPCPHRLWPCCPVQLGHLLLLHDLPQAPQNRSCEARRSCSTRTDPASETGMWPRAASLQDGVWRSLRLAQL